MLAVFLGAAVAAQHASTEIQCWGEDAFNSAAIPTFAQGVFDIAVVHEVGCAINATDSHVVCWGDDSSLLNVPANLGAASHISGELYVFCAVTAVGALRCWGESFYGNLINDESAVYDRVKVGKYDTCAQYQNRTLVCYGSATESTVPTTAVKQFDTGSNAACAITATDELVCWGTDAVAAHTTLPTATAVAVGDELVCIIEAADATVHCVGSPSNTFSVDMTAKSIAAAQDVMCATDANNTVVCFNNGGSFDPPLEFTLSVVNKVEVAGALTLAGACAMGHVTTAEPTLAPTRAPTAEPTKAAKKDVLNEGGRIAVASAILITVGGIAYVLHVRSRRNKYTYLFMS